MRFKNTNKQLRETWRPILNKWLNEAYVMDSNFSVTIITETETPHGSRGTFYHGSQLIGLPIGSNDLAEIKFCFLHEVRHYQQCSKKHIHSMPLLYNSTDFKIERDANRFALKYTTSISPFISKVLSCFNIKD